MADAYWGNGSGDGDFDTTGNWEQSDGSAFGSVPNPGDNIYYDANYSNDNCVRASAGAAVDNIYVSANYSGNIGTAGSTIEFSSGTVTLVSVKGSGQVHLLESGTAAFTTIVCRSKSRQSGALSINCNPSTVYAVTGRLDVVGGTVAVLHQGWLNNRSGDSFVNVQTGGIVTTYHKKGGSLLYEGTTGMTTANLMFGTSNIADGNITTLVVGINEVCNYYARGHTITTATVDGMLDLTKKGVGITVTNAINVSGKLVTGDNVTLSADPTIIGGGQLITSSTQSHVRY